MKYLILVGLTLLVGCQYTPDFRAAEQPAAFYHSPQDVEEMDIDEDTVSDTAIEEDLD